MTADRYTRTVMLLKIVLPMLALGILSTLFLLSRTIETAQNVPFASPEIRDRLLNQQITEPYYSAMSSDGDEITFIADTVTTPGGLDGAKSASEVEATFLMTSGTVIDVVADTGFFDLEQDYSSLSGDVVVTTSRGYVVRSQQLYGKLSKLDLHSPDRITGDMPGGDLEAGNMSLTAPERGAPAYLLFRGGVKLVYEPERVKD